MEHKWREHETNSGDFKDVYVSQIYRQSKNGRRRGKFRETPEAMKRYNEYRSNLRFERLCNTNLDGSWYRIHPTYLDECYPENEERAKKDIANYIDRLKRLYKRFGVEFKALWVMRYGEESGRVHFHMFVSGGVDIRLVASKWKYGRCNPDLVQFIATGVADCAAYYWRDSDLDENGDNERRKDKYSRRWGCTRNLKEPDELPPRDNKFRLRDVDMMFAESYEKGLVSAEAKAYLEQLYPGWSLSECFCIKNEVNGGRYIRFKMYKNDSPLLAWMREAVNLRAKSKKTK